jgi:hypothetical protein
MSRAGRVLSWSLLLLFLIYVGGYVVYRLRGPIVLHYPRGGGPPGLLVNVETREFEFFANLFLPCIEAEDIYHAHKP